MIYERIRWPQSEKAGSASNRVRCCCSSKNRYSIYYKPDNEFCRGPISHTCGPCSELPTTYNSFCELREEFYQVLQRNLWEFDIA